MVDVFIEHGTAKVPAGEWLAGRDQPTAFFGTSRMRGLKGFVVPDRAATCVVTTSSDAWFAAADRPFVTRFDALPDDPLNLVSGKLLVAPLAARTAAKSVKLVPLSFNRALPVTCFNGGENVPGWAVAATRGRVTRAVLEDGGTLTVRPEAVVAWTGRNPTGFCPKLTILDVLLPRGPKNLAFTFHGPAVVWFEGSFSDVGRTRSRFRGFRT